MLEASTASGLSLYTRPERGNASETVTVAAALERLGQLLGPGLVVCTDASFGYIRHLCAADRAGLRFVVPLRDVTGFRDLYRGQVGLDALEPLDYVAGREQHLPADRRSEYRGCLRRFPVEDPQTAKPYLFRVAFIWSAQEAKTVVEARQRTLDKAEEALQRVQRGLGNFYKDVGRVQSRVAAILSGKAKGLIKVTVGEHNGKLTLHWERDQQTIADASASDGIYALATNLSGELTPTDLLRIYKEQSLVELRHRDLKGSLRVRPIFLHNDNRIQALVSIVGLALLIFGLIELDLRRQLGPNDELQGLLPEGRAARPTARNILAAFQGMGLTYTSHGIRLDRLTVTQRRLLHLLDISPPWPEQRDPYPSS